MHSEVIEGYALSPGQKSLWLQQQHSGRYCAQSTVLIEGRLETERLQEAIREVVGRHEILRTTFQHSPGISLPFQIIGDANQVAWHEYELGGESLKEQEAMIESLSASDRTQPFDAESGPLARVSLLTLSAQRYVLLLNVSPLCADAVTLDNFVSELAAIYASLAEGASLSTEPIQYADFAIWQQELFEGEDAEAALTFWRKKDFQSLLAQATPFESRSANPEGFEPDSIALRFDAQEIAGIEATASKYNASTRTFLLACWQTLIQRLTKNQEIVVGDGSDGRKYEELRPAFGLFAKQLPSICRFEDDSRFTAILEQVEQSTTEAQQWDEYFTWEGAVQSGLEDSWQVPFFPLAFEFAEQSSPFAAGGLTWTPYKQEVCTERFKLKLRCLPTADKTLNVAVQFDGGSITRASAERLAGYFQKLVSGATLNPTAPVSELEFIGEDERRMLTAELNQTSVDFGAEQCFHKLFEAQAARTPERVAVVSENGQITYGELDRKSNQLARHLSARGVGRETRVGLFIERETDLVTGMLAVLKAGAAYVPLDPGYPKARLAGLIEDAELKLVLTQEHLTPVLPADAESLCVDTQWAAVAVESSESVESGATPENLAYMIYTSGSTGKPKGVTLEHRQLFNYVSAIGQRLQFPEHASYATVSTFAADLGHTMVFPALSNGGTLHLISHDRASDPKGLADYFTLHQIDCLKIVPSHLQALLTYAQPEQLLPRKLLVLGGEASSWELIEQLQALAPECRIFNHYGPTESTVGIITHEVAGELRQHGAATLPLGRPLANTEIYLLDARLEPVPTGVAGSLYVGGAGLSRGYLHHPGMTAEKFVPNPFSARPGARLYKTGDQARYLPDGNIEFLGRGDNQVKFHGFRVELNEIRSELNRHPQVSDSLILVSKGSGGNELLVAYYVSRQELPAAELRAHLASNIIEETIPNTFIHMQKLPLTLNGKLNYQALPSVEEARQKAKREIIAPRTPTEQLLFSIWADVLGTEQISLYDNFFELGGHSLLATQVISRIREAFQVELPLRDLFESPTVAALAECLEAAKRNGQMPEVTAIVPVSREQVLPLSFAQQRLWFVDQLEAGNTAYNMPAAVRLNGQLDAAALEHSLNEIVRRHEVLRTTFGIRGDQPAQLIADSLHIPLPVTDLSELAADEREAEVLRRANEESHRPFDLATGPLMRAALLRLSADENVLLITMHHIISDAWSINVFTRELAAFYEGFQTGKQPALPPLAVQYADFAAWQREWLQGESLETEIAFWKEQLAGAPPVLTLPTDRPRPETQSFRGARHRQLIPQHVAESLKSLGRREGSTLFMTLLASFQTLLHRYTGQDDIVVGTDIANRNRQETENLIGFFVNHPILRANLGGNPSFRELLAQVREVTLGAYAHQDVPFDKLVSALRTERSMSYMPIFQVLLVLRNTAVEPLRLPGLTLELMPIENHTAKFDVALFLEETEHGLAAVWNYSTDLFDASTIERMSERFEQLLQQIASQPDVRVNELQISGLENGVERVAQPTVVAAPTTTSRAATLAGYVAPRNPVEEVLAGLWSQILGVEKIGIHDNFFELGGDSIISIRIIARAIQQGLRLTPKQFFQYQTIAELATVAGTTPIVQAEQGLVTGSVPLTPIQQRFFARGLSGPQHFNQGVLLEIDQTLDPALLQETVKRLLEHHDALRLRYTRPDSAWEQSISGETSETSFQSLDFAALSASEQESAIEKAIDDAQAGLELAAGSLLKVTHLDLGATRPSLLFVVVHHLAVDIVSWRILMEDLQSVYQQLSEGRRPELPAKTTSFKQWAERLTQFVRSGGLQQSEGYWLDQTRKQPAPLPADFTGAANTLASARSFTTALDADETRALLQDVPQVYHTQINDVLLTALAQAFAKWTKNNALLVELEGHGREELFDDVDISRTVGWFTSLYPVLLEIGKSDTAGDALKLVKETLRGVPDRGLSYGLLRYLGEESSELRRGSRSGEVSFNYLGQIEQGSTEFSAFGRVKESRSIGKQLAGERTHVLEIDAKVVAGQLQVDWTYSDNIHRRETIETLAAAFQEALRALISHCLTPEAGGFTPSDFPEAELSQSELDALLASLN